MEPEELIPTRINREAWEVEPALIAIGLDSVGLRRIAAKARADASNATPFHAANASGTYSYQTGTYSLRDEYITRDSGWHLDRTNGIEAVFNLKTMTRVVFSNVDLACDDEHEPKARSEKGAGAERACAGNLFGDYLLLPRQVPRMHGQVRTYYLMVDGRGFAELSLALVRGGKFTNFVERNYLFGYEDDGGQGERLPLDNSDTINDFDPQVQRKA